jgi:hypothetical protein
MSIKGLDEKKIKDWWEENVNGLYHGLIRNCANVVEDALQEGEMPLRNRWPRTPNNLLGDVLDVLKDQGIK